MKTLGIEQTTLDSCVHDAQQDRIVLTRGGRPVAMVVGLEGLDPEQLELSKSDELWKLIAARRRQPTLTRTELEQRLAEKN